MTTPPLGSLSSAEESLLAASQRDKRYQRNLVVTLVGGAVALVSLTIIALGLFGRYASKFVQTDRRQEALSYARNAGQPVQTTYANPTYGVTMKLPGEWIPSKVPTRFLCHLIAFDRFHAVLEVDFPVFSPNIDNDAVLVARRYQARNSWTLNSEQSLQVSGYPAHLLRFSTARDVDADVLLIKKWPPVYGLSFAGPKDDADHWKLIRDAMPNALDIR
jgi:hypothetical protein